MTRRVVIGERTPRLEDPPLVTGQGQFVDDIRFPDMLHAAFVRSPHPHASIRGIETDAAQALPGVRAVYTLKDLRPHLTTDRMPIGLPTDRIKPDMTPLVLARDEVCFVGEAIAVVLAESRYVAEDAAVAVFVDYEPLDAVSDCRAAIEPGAPKAHRNASGNRLAEYKIGYGDCGTAFGTASHRFRLSLKQHRGGPHPIETRGVVARYEPVERRLTVWTSTQMAHEVQSHLVTLFGCDENQVRVVTPDVGGGFGGKFLVYPEEAVVALAARMLGRPVKWIEDRREHFLSTIQERDQYWEIEAATDDEGRLLAVRGTLIHDQGAYTPQGLNLSYNSATAFPGPYILPNYDLRIIVAQTNKVPTMPVRGAGYPQGTFAMERLMDHLARELGLDRAEVRRRNLVPPEKMPYETPMKTRAGTPVCYDSGDFPQCQAMALDTVDYAGFAARQAKAREDGRYLGIGLANGAKGTGRGPFESGLVRIGRSGKISVYTGAMPMGQGTKTTLAQICAEQFGVDPSEITVVAGDTAAVSLGLGGFASRQAVTAGSSVYVAASRVREKALKIASHLLEAAEQDLEIADGQIRITDAPGPAVSLGQIAAQAGGVPGLAMGLPPGVEPGLEHTAHFMTDGLTYSNACHAVEVEVDVDTGAVRILRYVIVNDSGRLINPMIVDGQLIGGAVHGIGNALFEWMGYDADAQPVTTNYGEYLLPTAAEIPRIEVIHHESPSPLNPLGVKGVGELGTIPAAAAVVSAVENALTSFGVRITETPIFPARIVELVTAANAPAI